MHNLCTQHSTELFRLYFSYTPDSCLKLAFHDSDSDSLDTSIYILTSDTRDFLASILTRKSMSVSLSVSVSAPWNASLSAVN